MISSFPRRVTPHEDRRWVKGSIGNVKVEAWRCVKSLQHIADIPEHFPLDTASRATMGWFEYTK
jgi:hypothetical protein